MATPRQATPKEAEENKRKQTLLRSLGYSLIKVDGSWGPWLDRIYREAMNKLFKKPSRGTPKIAAIALPLAVGATAPISVPAAAGVGITGATAAALSSPEVRDFLASSGKIIGGLLLRTYNTLSSYFYPDASSPAPASSGTTTSTSPTAPTDSVPTLTPPPPSANPSPAPAGGSTTGSNTSATPNPAPPDPDSDKKKKSRYFWETEKNSPGSSKTGRALRNFGIRVPVYTTVANWGLPTVGNAFSLVNTGKAPLRAPLTSYIPGVFEGENNQEQAKTLVPVSINGQIYYVDPSENVIDTTQLKDSVPPARASDLYIAPTDSLDF